MYPDKKIRHGDMVTMEKVYKVACVRLSQPKYTTLAMVIQIGSGMKKQFTAVYSCVLRDRNW